MFGVECPRAPSVPRRRTDPSAPRTATPRWPPTRPPCRRPSGEASTSSAICRARCGLPAFIAKVADSASIVVWRGRCGQLVAGVAQERGGLLGLAEHPELVGRPGQCPRDQFGSDSAVGSTAASTASASRPRPCQASACPSSSRAGKAVGAVQRGPAKALGQGHIAQPERLFAGRHGLVDRLRGVAVEGQFRHPQPVAGVLTGRAPTAGGSSRLRSRRAPSSPSAAARPFGEQRMRGVDHRARRLAIGLLHRAEAFGLAHRLQLTSGPPGRRGGSVPERSAGRARRGPGPAIRPDNSSTCAGSVAARLFRRRCGASDRRPTMPGWPAARYRPGRSRSSSSHRPAPAGRPGSPTAGPAGWRRRRSARRRHRRAATRAAARSSAAGLPMSATSTRWLNAPNGTSRSVGVPVTRRMTADGMGRRVVLGGQSRQGGLADSVGSQHNCPRAMGVGEGGLQLLQRVVVLGDAPPHRHRRILLRWRGIAGE